MGNNFGEDDLDFDDELDDDEPTDWEIWGDDPDLWDEELDDEIGPEEWDVEHTIDEEERSLHADWNGQFPAYLQ